MKISIVIILTFLALQVKSQTKEIDSLNKEYAKFIHLYDSCSKKWQRTMGIDSAGRWDAYVCMKYWQRKCGSLIDIIDHKKDIWLKDRLKTFSEKAQ